MQLNPQSFSIPRDTAAQDLSAQASANVHAAGKRQLPSSVKTFARDEMNLAEFPLAVLSTRVNPTVKTLEFADSQRLKDGEVIERKWIITGADKFGLPTSTDDDVVLGLMRLTMDHGFRKRKVYFTRYELLKILRWSTEGRSYQRLTKSLDRLSGVRIRATNAFYDNSIKAHQTRNFGLIDAYEINDERNSKTPGVDEKPKSFFIWSEVIFNSFKSGFIKKLDLEIYFSLKSAVSRRLYRYLDKHFYYKNSIEKPLMTLAFEKIGISRNYKYVSSVKQQIEPAAEELVQVGFLSSFEFSGEGSQTRVRFTRARPAQQLRQDASAEGFEQPVQQRYEAEPQLVRQQRSLIEALLSRGIALKQARRLMRGKSQAELNQINDIVAYYDHLVAANDHKVSRNRIGFLYRAVETPFKFVVPKEFVSSDDGAVNSGTKRRFVRPEHRVVSAPTKRGAEIAGQSDSTLQGSSWEKEYQQFISSELRCRQKDLDPELIAGIYQRVESNMSFLKSVLEPKRFRDAVEGCVRKELIKACNLPDISVWQKQFEQ